jgi:hypothetical protein
MIATARSGSPVNPIIAVVPPLDSHRPLVLRSLACTSSTPLAPSGQQRGTSNGYKKVTFAMRDVLGDIYK